LEDFVILIAKNHLPMYLVESHWFKRFSLHLCPRVVLPSKKQFLGNVLPKLVEKIKQFEYPTCFGRLLFCNNKFRFVNVKRGL
jgi:hypothetical protein